ncbi:MAG: HEPN domain-containing protein [Deltaproteobacteria bacterium]|nr:HEPN domain-containing protein [Deltaproteobacteria bacterium]
MTSQDLTSLIQHWLSSSDYDWETAQTLYKSKKYPYSLFFGHLSIEKLLKALYTKEHKKHAPFTHSLSYLAGKLSFELQKEQIQFLESINEFNIEARYPDEKLVFYKKADQKFSKLNLKKMDELRQWLKKQF